MTSIEIASSSCKTDDVKEAKQLEFCEICYEVFQHKNISCSTCKKCLCISCCNKLKLLAYGENSDENSDERGVLFEYCCPFCRNKDNRILLNTFSKSDILKIAEYDYIKHIKLYNEYNILKKQQDAVMYKNLKIKWINEDYKNNAKPMIEFLQEEIDELRKTNMELLELQTENEKLKEEIILRQIEMRSLRTSLLDETKKHNETKKLYNDLLGKFNISVMMTKSAIEDVYLSTLNNIRGVLNKTNSKSIKKEKILKELDVKHNISVNVS